MNDSQNLHEMKRTSLLAIAELKNLAVTASPAERSIIQKMINVEQNNVRFAEIALSCHQMADNALARVA